MTGGGGEEPSDGLLAVPSDQAIQEADDPVGMVLALCDRARGALVRAKSLAAAKDVFAAITAIDQITRIKRLSTDATVEASALRLQAERRMGELVITERAQGTLARHGGNRRSLNLVTTEDDSPATLSNHGLSYDEASAMVRLAEVPREIFDEALERQKGEARRRKGRVTRAGFLRLIDPEREKGPEARFRDAEHFIDACQRLAELKDSALVAIRFAGFPDRQPMVDYRKDVTRLLAEAASAIEAIQHALPRAILDR